MHIPLNHLFFPCGTTLFFATSTVGLPPFSQTRNVQSSASSPSAARAQFHRWNPRPREWNRALTNLSRTKNPKETMATGAPAKWGVLLVKIVGPVWYTIYHHVLVVNQPTNGKRTSMPYIDCNEPSYMRIETIPIHSPIPSPVILSVIYSHLWTKTESNHPVHPSD